MCHADNLQFFVPFCAIIFNASVIIEPYDSSMISLFLAFLNSVRGADMHENVDMDT